MSFPWIVAFVALWVVVLVIAVVVLGTLRRVIHVLQQAEKRLAASGGVNLGGAPPGTRIPAFE